MSITIPCWDSNPQPMEHESSPVTTTPCVATDCFADLFQHFAIIERHH